MPLHDYQCPTCGTALVDQYRSVVEGAQARAPLCPDCGDPMAWLPAIGMMDAFEPGQEFVTYDGQNRRIEIESFAQMRQLERDSEQQYRNGEGQPLRFRALHNSRSNRDVNTFGEFPQEKPTDAGKQRFGLGAGATPLVSTDGSAPDVAFGPGVHEGNASALKGGL
jgi:hypothetical protein